MTYKAKPKPKHVVPLRVVHALSLPPAEFVRVLASLITTAFAVCCGVAWNTTIQTIFKVALGSPDNISAQVIYAIAITLISIVVIVYIVRLASRISGEEIKANI